MKIVLSEQAEESLDNIIDFLLQKIPPQKVIETITLILEKAELLRVAPYAGQTEFFLDHLNKGHRRLLEGNYKIIHLKFK